MGVAEVQIPLFETTGGREVPRREDRAAVVRHVEYCRFPRVCVDQRLRVGFTRDLSPSGLCLRTDVPEPVGALLRITVRGIDGRPEREAIARVAWSKAAEDGSFWLGLAVVQASPGQPLRIRLLRRIPSQREVA